MTRQEAEFSVRTFLDNWRFWAGVFGVALVAMIVVLFVLNRDVSREQRARSEATRAALLAQREQCYNSLRSSPDLIALLDTLAEDRIDRIHSSQEAIELSPGDKLNAVRRRSILKSQQALHGIERFRRSIIAQEPTRKECDGLSARLGLQPQDSSR